MAGNRSFINYISDRFYNDFCSYIERHIEENQDKLDLKIQNVHDVGEILRFFFCIFLDIMLCLFNFKIF